MDEWQAAPLIALVTRESKSSPTRTQLLASIMLQSIATGLLWLQTSLRVLNLRHFCEIVLATTPFALGVEYLYHVVMDEEAPSSIQILLGNVIFLVVVGIPISLGLFARAGRIIAAAELRVEDCKPSAVLRRIWRYFVGCYVCYGLLGITMVIRLSRIRSSNVKVFIGVCLGASLLLWLQVHFVCVVPALVQSRGSSIIDAINQSLKLMKSCLGSVLVAQVILCGLYGIAMVACLSVNGPTSIIAPIFIILSTWIFLHIFSVLPVVVFSRISKERGTEKSLDGKEPPLPSIAQRFRVPGILGCCFLLVTAHSVHRTVPIDHFYAPAFPKDWVGSAFTSFMFHHALASYRGGHFMGVCSKNNPRNECEQQTYDVIDKMGLSTTIPHACPPGGYADASMVPRAIPFLLAPWLVTDEWLKEFRSLIKYPKRDPNTFRIVAHVRRGDITPCWGNNFHKYIPNSYYINMIKQYTPTNTTKKVEVVVHAIDSSFEPIDDFRAQNYTVITPGLHNDDHMGGVGKGDIPIDEVWGDLMTADVLLMAVSTFSFVPALLNRDGVVVYVPFHLAGKMPWWEMASDEETRRYRNERKELRKQCSLLEAGDINYRTIKRQRPEWSGFLRLIRHGPTGKLFNTA